MKLKKVYFIILVLSFMLGGCSGKNENYPSDYPDSPSYSEEDILYPENTGENLIQSHIANVDYSHVNQGYVMAYLNNESTKKIKIQISTSIQTYNYDLVSLEPVAFPLQMGNGEYLIKILENTQGAEYAIVKSQKINVELKDELTPFLYPNQLVDYKKGDIITKKSIELVKEDTNDLQRIRNIYDYVVHYLDYDDEKAKIATTKYILPNLTELFENKKGICFDYAAMMVAMLRINHIPARLICGNTDIEYHAWVEVYLEGQGWVNPDTFIDEKVWTRMDPTFASSKFNYKGQYEAVYYY